MGIDDIKSGIAILFFHTVTSMSHIHVTMQYL